MARKKLPDVNSYLSGHDDGCPYHATCLDCPYDFCCLDDPKTFVERYVIAPRNAVVVRLRRHGLPLKQIAAHVGLSLRMVARICKESDV